MSSKLGVVALLGLLLLAGCGDDGDAAAGTRDGRAVILAATTSLEDTGLLGELAPRFTEETGRELKTLSVPSGQALALVERGAADVAVTNAPVEERAALATGKVCCHARVMQNDFVVVGPPGTEPLPEDLTPREAMRAIAARELLFISRGDESGTNEFELGLWERAGVKPVSDRYLESGQGMGATLRIASDKAGLTLSDRGTFVAEREHLDLEILYASPAAMPAVYSLVLAKPGGRVNTEGGEALAAWLRSPRTQRRIADFEIGGEQLFRPAA